VAQESKLELALTAIAAVDKCLRNSRLEVMKFHVTSEHVTVAYHPFNRTWEMVTDCDQKDSWI
jgi:hypothetical protein